MRTETITERDDLVIRRLVLEPGEAMPWRTDPCRRFTVVIRGDLLHKPEPQAHRGVNAGTTPYEEVVVFFLDRPGIVPQPEHP